MRQDAAISEPNILRVLTNAYVTTGRKKKIKKRPCLEKIATLEAGTMGLKAFGGKLNTFYGDGAAIAHADTRFVARRAPHWTSGVAPTKIHYCDQYNALMYVVAEYAGPVYRHHYLDDPGAWVAATAYTLGQFRRPTNANGFRYEVTTAGTSAGAEPAWPTTIGATVADNTVVWTCRTFAITDTNCPQTKETTKAAQKMYAKGAGDATTVRFCKTGDPRDWTAVSDAGFLAAGLYAKGSDEVTAVGPFQKSGLWIAFADNSQVWTVDPNPANNALLDNIEGIGTLFHRAQAPVSRDLFFHAQNGFRSVSLVSLTNNLQDNDVGSAIDDLVAASVALTDNPLSLYYPKLGQFLEFNGQIAWAYSFSRTSKLSAWSKYTWPITIDDATVLNQELYVRSGDDVYKLTDTVMKDGLNSIPAVSVEMYAQDAKRPGVLKQFLGMDVIGTGNWTISHKFYDPGTRAWLESSAYEYPAVTEPGDLHPVELMATRIAPVLSHQKDEPAEMSMLMLHYENLGVV